MNENITNTIPSCEECGQCDVELFEVDGRLLCAECLENLGYERCEECGGWYRHRSMTTVYAGWRRHDYVLCEDCLQTALDNDNVFYCTDCGDYYDSQTVESYGTHDGDLICESCRSDHYVFCDRCGELYHEDDVVWDDDNEEYYCENCYDRMSRKRSIHDYSFKPYPIFHRRVDEPLGLDALTFGYELEVDKGSNRYECADAINNAFGDDVLYMKNDGSVDFEIVTHPHTLKAYLENFDFDQLCKIPLNYGYRSHEAGTCGFHIHVGREQLGKNQIERRNVIQKIVLLMYRHWDSLVKFSRRTNSQLDHWAKAPYLDFDTDRVSYDVAEIASLVEEQYVADYDRYRALNLCNSGTIEFRLWRGSLIPQTLKATLQLTSNICRFCMDNSLLDVIKSSWADIVNYETCPELDAYIAERDLADGCAPVAIPYKNEVAIPVELENKFRYEIGTPIVITKSDLLVAAGMVGVTGTVAGYKTSRDGDPMIAMLVDQNCEMYQTCGRRAALLHDCNGLTPDGCGYFVHPDNIRPIEDYAGFRVGDRVVFTVPSCGPHANGDDADVGTVVCLSTSHDGFIGVAVDNNRRGHSLDGHLPSYYDRNAGWWVNPAALAHIAQSA